MNNEEKDINKIEVPVASHETTGLEVPVSSQETTGLEVPVSSGEATGIVEDNTQPDSITELEDDIIRNDTIPETSKDTPGSNGAFPVGAFDTSKD